MASRASPSSPLRRDAASLRASIRRAVRIHRDGPRVFVIVSDQPLPPGRFAIDRSDLLIISDTDYPNSALDMFYLVPEAVRPDGSIPRNAENVEAHVGRTWRRFSWHSQVRWDPAGNPLCDHLAFAEQRLSEEP